MADLGKNKIKICNFRRISTTFYLNYIRFDNYLKYCGLESMRNLIIRKGWGYFYQFFSEKKSFLDLSQGGKNHFVFLYISVAACGREMGAEHPIPYARIL